MFTIELTRSFKKLFEPFKFSFRLEDFLYLSNEMDYTPKRKPISI